jgi:hypothetical protein
VKKRKTKEKAWAGYYDRADILDELSEGSVEFSLDDQLLRDVLGEKRKRKLQNVTIKMDPFQVNTIRKLATIKSMPYQTLVRHWIWDKIRQELSLAK